MSGPSRREFLAGTGATVGTLGLAGCAGWGPSEGTARVDRTVYVGAYHWGFVLLDEMGGERERIVLDPGTRVRLVAFNTGAEDAISRLPEDVRSAVPDHVALEERNETRIPTPTSGDLHEALDEANARYPDHSLAVVPSGYNQMPMGDGPYGPMGGGAYDWMGGGNQMGGGMDGGMMLHPIPLPADATQPTTAGVVASERGDFTLTCLTYCGYGHPFMEFDGAFVVR